MPTGELEVSAQNVGQASELIHEYSQDITRAIGEINEGMEEPVQTCTGVRGEDRYPLQ